MKESNYHKGGKRDHCYFCGAWKTEEHHIIPQRFDGPDSPTNTVEVCSECHKKLERLYDKKFYEYFGIKDEDGKRRFHTACSHHDCLEQSTHRCKNGGTYCEQHAKEAAQRSKYANTDIDYIVEVADE